MFGLPSVTLWLIAALVVGNVLTLAGWVTTAERYDRFKAETAAAGAVQEALVSRAEAQQERITSDVSNAWNDALQRVRADYARRLRDAGSGQVPGISRPPASIDAVPTDALALAGQCAETTLMLESLQAWITRQKEVAP